MVLRLISFTHGKAPVAVRNIRKGLYSKEHAGGVCLDFHSALTCRHQVLTQGPPCPVSEDTAVCEYANQDWCKCPLSIYKIRFLF